MRRLFGSGGKGDQALFVSCLGMVVNVILMVVKLVVGGLAGSGALFSDGVHSASDVFGSVVVIAGVRMGNKKSDREHPYGHERLECVAAFVLAAVLMGTGLGIGFRGVDVIIGGNYEHLSIPGVLGFWVALLAVFIKEGMFFYTHYIGKKLNSSILRVDAWHHQSDAMASLGGFVGILGARLGFAIMDPVAGIFISLFIIKAAYGVFRDAAKKMIDEACDPETIREIQDVAGAVEGVIQVDMVKTRLFGSKKYVDIEISADGEHSLMQAHEIAHQVHDVVEDEIDGVKHCMVHVNPL